MSLVCHRIVSNYAPRDDETAENEIEQDGAWEKEQVFGNTRRLHSKPAPTFIPAALRYDEFGIPKIEEEEEVQVAQVPKCREDVALWYRGITVKKESRTESSITKTNKIITKFANTSTLNPNTLQIAIAKAIPSKPNWFSTRPLHGSEPENANPTPSSLADLLSRNPPPLPSEPAFTPPIFLALGPSNKGFAMLQKKGWKEGEGLGKIPRADLEVKVAQKLRPEVIDLTQSDSENEGGLATGPTCESESETEDEPDEPLEDSEMDSSTSAVDAYEPSAHGGTALITPLGTVLKADRLGIGLKARRTKRVVTHSPAELATFVRKKRRLEKQKWGRGSKGLARKNREEEQRRVQMLKYLNE